MKKTTILIVEDHQIVSAAMSVLLTVNNLFEVVGVATSGEEAIENAASYQPDIILMDINLSGLNGIEATAKIVAMWPYIRIVAMTMHNQSYAIEQMMKAGASGYLSKNCRQEELFECIDSILNGHKYFSNEAKELIVAKVMNAPTGDGLTKRLSKREVEVARYISEGKSSKEIADKLLIAIKTVEVHRYNLLKKLKSKNSIEMVNYLHKNPYILLS